jgi:hypothetical protein
MSHEIVDDEHIGVYGRHGKIGVVIFKGADTAKTELEYADARRIAEAILRYLEQHDG